MSNLLPFEVKGQIDVLVTPKEETNLTDLKQGEDDPVIKWSFTWQFDKRNFVTR
jgi:hypothetical protein